jgi:hypothetical protein
MTATQRQKQVVCRLYNNKQTIYTTSDTFSYNTPITRAQAAKFMTVFVQDMLAKTKVLDTKVAKRVCTFNDRNMIISESLKSYMYQSCEYGIFQ